MCCYCGGLQMVSAKLKCLFWFYWKLTIHIQQLYEANKSNFNFNSKLVSTTAVLLKPL